MNRRKVEKLLSGQNGGSQVKRVAIYIRVSTVHQVDRDSLPMQRKDLITYCELILGIEDYEIFEDAGYSGKNTVRPAYQEMMKKVRLGEFSHILVWKIDRISRNLLDFAKMYEELKKLGVTFVSKNEQFDTSTAIGEAMLKIILVFAELERNMTSERVSAAMLSRANNGQWNGGRIPYGYNYDPETGEFSFNSEEYNVCRMIKDDYIERKSLLHTSRYLNEQGLRTRAGAEWSPTTIWIIVSSPFYAGIYRYNRFKGTESRTKNPVEEWVMIPNHHPAIFSLEEHEAMLKILEENSKKKNSSGKQCLRKNVHIFSGIAFCGKCGSKMVSTPGRLHADGYRGSNYSCPKRRKSGSCDNQTISDVILGEFLINYILNMLNAKRQFSKITSPDDLEQHLLYGNTFSDVDHIEECGLHEFYNLLSMYKSDDSYVISARRKKKRKAPVDPEIASLRKEKEKQERALKRLQDLYLYSDNAISEKDYILRKKEITDKLEDICSSLGMASRGAESSLSDEDFIRMASHLLISKQLTDRKYIYFRNLAKSVSPEILKEYMDSILDSVMLIDGRVSCIVFKNGLTHKFIYK